MDSRRLISAAFVVGVLLASQAHAATITYALPEFLGAYTFDDFSYTLGVSRARTQVDAGLSVGSARRMRVILVGTVTSGRYRGDGVTREALEGDLIGGVALGLHVAGFGYLATLSGWGVEGPFVYEREFDGPFYSVIPMPTPNPPALDVTITATLQPDWFAMAPTLPERIDPAPSDGPPYELRLWSDGLDMLEPLSATITEAYLEIDVIPEPATPLLLLAGAALIRGVRYIFCARKSRARY